MEILVRQRGDWSMVLIKAVNQTKRAVKIIVGFLLLLAGAIMLVTPGPGWAAIFAGLAILATEFRWAKRLLSRVKQEGFKLRDRIRKPPREQPLS